MKTPKFVEKTLGFLKTLWETVQALMKSTTPAAGPVGTGAPASPPLGKKFIQDAQAFLKIWGKSLLYVLCGLIVIVMVLYGLIWVGKRIVPNLEWTIIQVSVVPTAGLFALWIGSNHGRLAGWLTLIIPTALVILIPLGISAASTSWLSPLGYTIGAIVLVAGIYFAVKHLGVRAAVAGATSGIEPRYIGRGLAVAGIWMFAVSALLTLVGVKTGRNIWSDIQETLFWGFGCVAVGALTYAFFTSKWGKAGGVLVAYLGLSMMWAEAGRKVSAEEAVVINARQQELQRVAANTPPSEKFWTMKEQNYTPEGIVLTTYSRYNVTVRKLDADFIDMTMGYVELGRPQYTFFLWKRHEGPDGIWWQQNPVARGTFRLWQEPGGPVDHWVGVLITQSGTRLRLELDGKLTP